MAEAHLFVFSASSPAALAEALDDVRRQLGAAPAQPLRALAAALAARPRHPTRLAVIAEDADALVASLDRARAALLDSAASKGKNAPKIGPSIYYADAPAPGKTVLLFPGIGSAYDGMMGELAQAFPSVAQWFRDMDALLAVMAPHAVAAENEPNLLPQNGLPNFIGTMAMFGLMQRAGVQYDALAGHSNGENAALVASCKMAFRSRDDLMLILSDVLHASVQNHAGEYVAGVTLAVSGVPVSRLEALCAQSGGKMVVAMVNCPTQVVMFVTDGYADQARELIAGAGGLHVQLPLQEPLHTPFFRPAMPRLSQIYDAIRFEPGVHPVYSCNTAQLFPAQPAAIRSLALSQWINQVRFQAMLEQLYADGFRTFVEVGPGSVLTGFVTDTLRGRGDFRALATDNPRRPDVRHFLETLGRLFVHGQDLDLANLYGDQPERAPATVTPVRSEPGPSPAWDGPRTGDLPPAAGVHATLSAPLPAAARAAAPVAVGVDPRTQQHLLESHFALMQEFLGSQERTLVALRHALTAPAHTDLVPARPHAAEIALPLLGATPATDGSATTLDVTVDVARLLMLLDHALANQNEQTPPGMSPLPLVPFAVSMEYMAEAAATLRPGWFVRRLEKLRSYRWLALDDGTLPLQVRAECTEQTPDSATIAVQVFTVAGVTPVLAVEGVVHMEATPPVHTPQQQVHVDGRAPVLPFPEFYARYLFHGPRFRAIRAARAVADDGIEVVMAIDPQQRYQVDAALPDYLLPLVFLDCLGQSTAYILYERAHKHFALFPFQIESFEQFSPQLARAQQVRARSHAELKEAIVTTTLEFLDDHGRVLGRVANFRQRYFDDPQVAQFIAPQTPELFHSAEPNAGPADVTACITTGFSTELFTTSDGIWLRALAGQVLAPAEFATWHALPKLGPRRMHWLLGRVAAKDAVRRWARATHGLALMPWDIAIANAASGRPAVACPALAQFGPLPDLAISHSHDRAVAAVCPALGRVGIDLEFAPGRDQAILASILSDAERALLQQAGGVALTELLFCWCAKEAAAKASGKAKGVVPYTWRLAAFAPPTAAAPHGHATVVHDGVPFSVTLWHEGDAHLALCHLPAPDTRTPAGPSARPVASSAPPAR